MKFRSIASITVLVAVLIGSFLAIVPAPASAQSPYQLSKITGFGSGDIIGADYDDIEGILWVMTSQDTGSFRIGRAYSVNATTDAIISSGVVYNETNTNNVLLDFDCNYPYCYFSHGSGTSNEDGEVYRFSITSSVPSIDTSVDKTLANTSDDYAYLVAAESGSFGGTNLIFSRVVNSGGTTTLRGATFDGLSADMDASSPLTKTFDSSLASFNHYFTSLKWSQKNAPDNDVFGSAVITNGATSAVYVYSLDSDTITCEQTTISNDSVYSSIVPDHFDYNYFYFGGAGGNIHAFNISNCAAAYSLNSAATGLSNDIFDMSIVEIGETKYLVARDVGSGGNISFMPYNETTDQFEGYEFIINSAPGSAQGNAGTGTQTISHTTVGRIVNAFDVEKMFIPMTNTDRAMMVIDLGTPSGEGGIPGGFSGTICVDFNDDDIIDQCYDSSEGVVTLPLADVPPLMDDIAVYAPFFVATMTGIEGEAANVLLGMVAPLGIIMLLGAAHKKVELPPFIFGIGFLAGMGVSVGIGWLESWWIIVGILGFATSFAGQIKKVLA